MQQAGDIELHPGLIFCLGNPLLDITADVDVDFLTKWEIPENLAILAEEGKHDGLYADMVKRYGNKIVYTAGGATQNTARVIQWFFPNNKEVVIYSGAIGNDKFGEILSKASIDDGLNTCYMVTEESSTGTCAVCVTANNTKRSLVAYLGAANCFKKEHIDKNWSIIEKAKLFYSSGFHLTVSPDSMLAIAKHSAEIPDKTYCLNLAAPFISQFFSEPLLSLLPYVDILFGNESESAAFAKTMKWDTEDNVEIAKKIALLEKNNPSKRRIVVITQGADDVIVAVKESNSDVEVTQYPIKKIDPSKIVDTNSAGDAFVGGFLAQFVRGKDINTCVSAGNFAAYEVLQRSGCALPEKCLFEG